MADYAQLFGGKIEVESPARGGSKGTTFRVTFPVEVLDAESQPDEREEPGSQSAPDYQLENENAVLPLAPAQMGTAPDKPTLLVVEDNPDLQDYLSLILKEKYHVLIAGNGREALDCLLQTADCQQPTDNQQPIKSPLKYTHFHVLGSGHSRAFGTCTSRKPLCRSDHNHHGNGSRVHEEPKCAFCDIEPGRRPA